MLGLAYANLCLFFARYIQYGDDSHIHAPRRVFLWFALTVGAFGCGYIRSKIGRSYLGINFFMLVNMFALIRGINHFDAQFHMFFFVMFFGACASLLVSVAVWPEDRGGTLKREAIKAIGEVKGVVASVRQTMISGGCEEVDMAAVKSAERALATSLHEANYEISFARVDSSYLIPLERCMCRLISAVRVLNASVRRKRRVRLGDPLNHYTKDTNSINTRRTMDTVLANAQDLLDVMTARVEGVYSGTPTPLLDHAGFVREVDGLCSCLNEDVTARSVTDHRDLENSAFTDQINTTVLDILDICKDMARAVTIIEPIQSRIRFVLPRKLRRNEFEHSEPHGVTFADKGRSDGISRFDAMSRGRSMMASDEAYLLFLDSTTVLQRMGIWMSERLIALHHSRHAKYAFKFTVVMSALALPAYIGNWYVWYDSMRAQLAMISAMVAMETTRGMTIRTAGMKLLGAVTGGITAFVVVGASQGYIVVSIALTSVVGVLIGWLVLHPVFSKSGTVFALAYNLILGVATVFPEQGPAHYTLGRRLATLPVGLLVATFVHLTLFPYHAREEMVKSLGSSLDWLHHLLFAIEASEEHPSLQQKFDAMVQKASNRVGFAKGLLPATHYEISLGGHWPYERFECIVEKIIDMMDIIVGEVPADPVLAIHLLRSTACERVRTKLLGSLCNDLLVISHTLSARLFMPRHESMSTLVLQEYIDSLLSQARRENGGAGKNYVDVGRLADLVSEMSFLREEVDQLTAETQCPKNGLLPHLSFHIRKSQPGTPSTSRGRSRAASPATPRVRSRVTSPSAHRGRSRTPSVVEFALSRSRAPSLFTTAEGEGDIAETKIVGDENV